MNRESYRKDSGIKIDKDHPYLTYPGRSTRRRHEKALRPRKVHHNGEYLQVIADWDQIHHKWINQKRIIHTQKTTYYQP